MGLEIHDMYHFGVLGFATFPHAVAMKMGMTVVIWELSAPLCGVGIMQLDYSRGIMFLGPISLKIFPSWLKSDGDFLFVLI